MGVRSLLERNRGFGVGGLGWNEGVEEWVMRWEGGSDIEIKKSDIFI